MFIICICMYVCICFHMVYSSDRCGRIFASERTRVIKNQPPPQLMYITLSSSLGRIEGETCTSYWYNPGQA